MTTVVASARAPHIGVVLLAWLLIATIAAATDLIGLYPLPLPSLVLLLTAALLFALWRSEPLRARLHELGPTPLVALHLTRFVGFAFLLLGARGELPSAWAVPTGVGDIVVALTAVPVLLFAAPFRTAGQRRALLAWNVLGLADMLMVIGGAVRMIILDPAAGGVMERLPMSLLPTFLVPLIVASHVMLFVWLYRTRAAAPAPAA